VRPQVKEFSIDYTQCQNSAPSDSFAQLPSDKYSYSIGSSSVQPPSWQFTSDDSQTNAAERNLCRVTFDLPVELKKPVFMYYKRELPLFPHLARSLGLYPTFVSVD